MDSQLFIYLFIFAMLTICFILLKYESFSTLNHSTWKLYRPKFQHTPYENCLVTPKNEHIVCFHPFMYFCKCVFKWFFWVLVGWNCVWFPNVGFVTNCP